MPLTKESQVQSWVRSFISPAFENWVCTINAASAPWRHFIRLLLHERFFTSTTSSQSFSKLWSSSGSGAQVPKTSQQRHNNPRKGAQPEHSSGKLSGSHTWTVGIQSQSQAKPSEAKVSEAKNFMGPKCWFRLGALLEPGLCGVWGFKNNHGFLVLEMLEISSKMLVALFQNFWDSVDCNQKMALSSARLTHVVRPVYRNLWRTAMVLPFPSLAVLQSIHSFLPFTNAKNGLEELKYALSAHSYTYTHTLSVHIFIPSFESLSAFQKRKPLPQVPPFLKTFMELRQARLSQALMNSSRSARWQWPSHQTLWVSSLLVLSDHTKARQGRLWFQLLNDCVSHFATRNPHSAGSKSLKLNWLSCHTRKSQQPVRLDTVREKQGKNSVWIESFQKKSFKIWKLDQCLNFEESGSLERSIVQLFSFSFSLAPFRAFCYCSPFLFHGHLAQVNFTVSAHSSQPPCNFDSLKGGGFENNPWP